MGRYRKASTIRSYRAAERKLRKALLTAVRLWQGQPTPTPTTATKVNRTYLPYELTNLVSRSQQKTLDGVVMLTFNILVEVTFRFYTTGRG